MADKPNAFGPKKKKVPLNKQGIHTYISRGEKKYVHTYIHEKRG